MVLAACAMGSGCGQVLRGMTECAFPYANLASLDILEEFSGYVAGVTNPRFEELPMTWDVLCNLETGKVTVSKNLRSASVSVGSIRSSRSSETSLSASIVKVDDDNTTGTPQTKRASVSRADCVDNQFMDEVSPPLFVKSTWVIDYCRSSRQCHPTMANPTSDFDSQTILTDSSVSRLTKSTLTPVQLRLAIRLQRFIMGSWGVESCLQMIR